MNTSNIESLALTQSPHTIRDALAILPALLGVNTYETLNVDHSGRGTMTVRSADVVCHFDIEGRGALPTLAKVTRDEATILDESGAAFFGALLSAGKDARGDRFRTLTDAEVDANIAAFASAIDRIAATVAG